VEKPFSPHTQGILSEARALGLLPLLFSSGTGSEVQRPLATVVVVGLVTSTVLTLLVIPALYTWFGEQLDYETDEVQAAD
jgi:Cu/Ag efflux pump CusA